ncbi:acyltransferase family protein [Actinomycetota bacterium Odt1-20B]
MTSSIAKPVVAERPMADTTARPQSGAAVLVRSQRNFEPAIDGLRALATFMVVFAHTAQWTGSLVDSTGKEGPFAPVMTGFLAAIPIFLIVSGYLLYRPWADAALGGRSRPKATHYYWHRVLRIFPAYWLFILTALFVFDRDGMSDTWRTVRLLTVQHVQHWADLRSDPGELSNWAQTWSLATEVHFYLALPVVAFVLHRILKLRHGVRAALVLLGGIVVADFTWLFVTTPSSPIAPPHLWWLRGYLGFLAAGMALAILAGQAATGRASGFARLVGRYPWACWALALLAFAVANTDHAGSIASITLTQSEVTIKYVCHLVIAVGLAAPLILARGRGPEQLLSKPLPLWLGRHSCGVFLWHLIVLQVAVRHLMGGHFAQLGTGAYFVLLPFVLVLSIAAGWASYTFVERPVMRRFRIKPMVEDAKK